MIEVTNSAAQTVAPGAAVTFDTLIYRSNCGECIDNGYNNSRPFNNVKLTGKGNTYKLEFSGNISSDTVGTPVQLAIAFGGTALPETVMESTPSAANAFNNVSTGTYVRNACGDSNRVTVVNTGTTPVLLSANMNLRISRRG